jgi:hypothetical protein
MNKAIIQRDKKNPIFADRDISATNWIIQSAIFGSLLAGRQLPLRFKRPIWGDGTFQYLPGRLREAASFLCRTRRKATEVKSPGSLRTLTSF